MCSAVVNILSPPSIIIISCEHTVHTRSAQISQTTTSWCSGGFRSAEAVGGWTSPESCFLYYFSSQEMIIDSLPLWALTPSPLPPSSSLLFLQACTSSNMIWEQMKQLLLLLLQIGTDRSGCLRWLCWKWFSFSPSLSSLFSFRLILITSVGRRQSQACRRWGEAGGYRKHEGVQWWWLRISWSDTCCVILNKKGYEITCFTAVEVIFFTMGATFR